MTTACEEKPTANFTREIGDQSTVSVSSLGYLSFALTWSSMSLSCAREAVVLGIVCLPSWTNENLGCI